MKVVWYSPLPPSASPVARFSALLVPALRERGLEVVASARKRRWRGEPDADLAVYQLADEPDEHAWIVELLLRRPGLVVLHDASLHRLVATVTLARGDRDGYLRALERDSGLPGRMLGYAVVDGRIPPLWETHGAELPLLAELLDRATGVVVHSPSLEAHVRATGFAGRVSRIPYPAEIAGSEPLDRVADAYLAALERAAGGETVLDLVLHDVARAAADVGLGGEREQVRELAARLREVGL